jgi:hypothetical protein
MATQLLFVHGRAQENKDAAGIKREWINAWKEGLAKHGLDIPLDQKNIHFPYYGQTLYDYTRGIPVDSAAEILFKGSASSIEQKKFIWSVLAEVQRKERIGDDEVRRQLAPGSEEVVEKNFLNWEWVQALLKVLDRSAGLSGQGIALATTDVYEYLTNASFSTRIDDAIRSSLSTGEPTVVVGHSLGTVVAYSIIRNMKRESGVRIPLLVTLGSPLGVTFVRSKFEPLAYPEIVGDWFNALDKRDVVALYPLDQDRLPLNPPIRNKINVRNRTENRHGISGYLDDPEVALEIYKAVVTAG